VKLNKEALIIPENIQLYYTTFSRFCYRLLHKKRCKNSDPNSIHSSQRLIII